MPLDVFPQFPHHGDVQTTADGLAPEEVESRIPKTVRSNRPVNGSGRLKRCARLQGRTL